MNERSIRKLRMPIILAIAISIAVLLIGSLAIIFMPSTPKAEYARNGSPVEEGFSDADFGNQGRREDYTPGPPLSDSADAAAAASASATALPPAQSSSSPAPVPSSEGLGFRIGTAMSGFVGYSSDSKSDYTVSTTSHSHSSLDRGDPRSPSTSVPEPGSGLLTGVGAGFFFVIVFIGTCFKRYRARG
ncbi:MAG: hypothetical protein LBQ00_02095 [Syntrophobacterales bacterium]|jgi:hypothetical protein|nr:hypothetical protein [Syntrophobacterales bacterium]